MKVFNIFTSAVCFTFLIKLRWPKTKRLMLLPQENARKHSNIMYKSLKVPDLGYFVFQK